MRLDSSLAWKEATQAVAANREVLAALAGVFFLLPTLALALFYPQPEPPPGANFEQTMAVMANWYRAAAPAAITAGVVQAVGILAILTLFTDRSRPTVAEAIRAGGAGLLPYIGAQILVGVAAAIAVGALLMLAAISGSPLMIIVVVTAAVAVVTALALRVSLVAPIVAVEAVRNPVAALRRSWDLTRGNALRILLFFALLLLVFGIVLALIMMAVGVVLALALDLGTAKTIASVVSATLSAGMSVYVFAALAAIHRQLAGPSSETMADTFS